MVRQAPRFSSRSSVTGACRIWTGSSSSLTSAGSDRFECVRAAAHAAAARRLERSDAGHPCPVEQQVRDVCTAAYSLLCTLFAGNVENELAVSEYMRVVVSQVSSRCRRCCHCYHAL